MFEKLKKSKKSLVILAIFIVLVLIYWIFRGKDEPLVSVIDSEFAQENLVGQELLDRLEKLKSLDKINTNFFSDPVFESLKDTKVQPVSQPIGRNNLFTPSGDI